MNAGTGASSIDLGWPKGHPTLCDAGRAADVNAYLRMPSVWIRSR